MTKQEIETNLREIVCDQLGLASDKVTLASRFSEDLSVDSMDSIEIIMAVEECLGLTLTSEQDKHVEEHIKTFGEAVDWISETFSK